MCYKLLECINVFDLISLLLGVFLSEITTIYIIKFFRPKICLGIPIIKDFKSPKPYLIIPVKNIDKKNKAVNIKIEAAAVLRGFTYHLKFDRYEFLILNELSNLENDTQNERKFHAFDIEDYTQRIAQNCQNLDDFIMLLENENSYLRVRVHANHEFTGFGKAFEARFKLKNGKFVPLSPLNPCQDEHF
jgi:hypothetical protein